MKEHLANRIAELSKHVESKYSGQLRKLKEGPKDVVSQKNLSSTSPAQKPFIVQKGNEGVSQRTLSFVTDFRDILMKFVKKIDRMISLELLDY